MSVCGRREARPRVDDVPPAAPRPATISSSSSPRRAIVFIPARVVTKARTALSQSTGREGLQAERASGTRVQGRCAAVCWHGCVNVTESLRLRCAVPESYVLSLKAARGPLARITLQARGAKAQSICLNVLQTNTTVHAFAVRNEVHGITHEHEKSEMRSGDARPS